MHTKYMFFICDNYFSDEEGKSVADNAMKHWMKHTCVKFVSRTTEKDFVEFQFADA